MGPYKFHFWENLILSLKKKCHLQNAFVFVNVRSYRHFKGMQSVSIFTHRQFISIIICICMVYIHSARGICSTHFCENYFCKFLSGWHQYHHVRYREWNLQKLKGIHSAITVDLHKESWDAEEARLDTSEKRRPCWVLYWAVLAIFIINQNDKLSQVVLSTQLKWRTNVKNFFF